MKVKFLQCFFMFFVLLFVANCARAPIIQHDQLSAEPSTAGYVYIIVGEELAGENLTAMLVPLYIGGDQYPTKGIARSGVYSEKELKLPDATYTLYKEPTFQELPPNEKHAYRIWKIPFEKISKNGKAIIYVTALFEGKLLNWIQADINTLKMTQVPAPIEFKKYNYPFTDAEYNFKGNKFEIKKPGIYYVGEFKIYADIEDVKDESFGQVRNLNFKHVNAEARVDSLARLLTDYGLQPTELVDLSGTMQTLEGKFLNDYVKGK